MLDELAKIIKVVAREELLPRFADTERRYKADGSIVTAADLAVQSRLARELAVLAPDYRLLGEEMTAEEQSALLDHSDTGLWCLDPLDGTSNFASGVPFFSISLGLLVGRKPVLGLVYDPIRDECFTAKIGEGAWLNGVPLHCQSHGVRLRSGIAVVDFKRLPAHLASALVAKPPYCSQRNFGSVALEWCWLAANRFQVYLHGKQQLWDYSAGILVFSEAGGVAENMQGEPFLNPALQPSSAVAACDQKLFDEWKVWVEQHNP